MMQMGNKPCVVFVDEFDKLFISSPGSKFNVRNSEKIPELARECCEILYDDISFPRGNMEPPRREHVQKALDFAKGRDNLIVACQMGVSRSSATAYLIKASIFGANEALDLLNPHVHNPNSLVIAHGANILGMPEMIQIIEVWKSKSEEAQWEGPFHV